MATITVAEVKQLQPSNLPDDVIDLMIKTVDKADACMAANNLSEDDQKLYKLLGVAHLLYLSSKANVASETSPTGATRRYRNNSSGSNLKDSPWGSQLASLDAYACIIDIVNQDRTMFIASVGPGGDSAGTIYDQTGNFE